MIHNAMVTEDNIMFIETDRGVWYLNLEYLSDIPEYENIKNKDLLKYFHLDYDAVIWNDKLDIAEHGFYKHGKKVIVRA